MHLYLVRHGQAKSEQVDPRRGLSEAGVRQVRRLARFLKPLRLTAETIWHSGKDRAAQTAEIVAAALAGSATLVPRLGLAPNDPVGPVRKEIARIRDDLIIVGHLPFLGRLTSALTAGEDAAQIAAFAEAAAACLEQTDTGAWTLRWLVDPDVLGE